VQQKQFEQFCWTAMRDPSMTNSATVGSTQSSSGIGKHSERAILSTAATGG